MQITKGMNTHDSLKQLLTPPKTIVRVGKGRPPHAKYRLIRGNAENIVAARDTLQWASSRAARRLGFRVAKEYEEAYRLLKSEGAAIVMRGDWSGVEAAVYAKFPHYLYDPEFRQILAEFNDPRLGTLPESPLLIKPRTEPILPQQAHPETTVPNTPRPLTAEGQKTDVAEAPPGGAAPKSPAADAPQAAQESGAEKNPPGGDLPFPVVRPTPAKPRTPWGGKNPTEPAFPQRQPRSS